MDSLLSEVIFFLIIALNGKTISVKLNSNSTNEYIMADRSLSHPRFPGAPYLEEALLSVFCGSRNIPFKKECRFVAQYFVVLCGSLPPVSDNINDNNKKLLQEAKCLYAQACP